MILLKKGELLTMASQHPRLIGIDKNIKPIIKTLNQKGYCTLYSCESHAEEEDKKIYRSMYINFQNEIPAKFQTLKNFIFDKDNKTLRHYIKSEKKSDIIREKNLCLEELKNWTNDLPAKKESGGNIMEEKKRKKRKEDWFQIKCPDKVFHQKVKYVAEAENRNVSSLVRFLLGKHIEKFEEENGAIEINLDKEN